MANAAQAGKTTVENNLLSNKYGVESLDEKGKALHKKLEEAGIGGIDELQEKFVRCNGSPDCERNTRDEYRIKEKEAGENLVALYQSGQLTRDEFDYLVTEYANRMLSGIEKGEKLSDTGFNLVGDIYRLSGSDWTPMGEIRNPYFSAIRSSERIADWKAQGLSNDKIKELMLKDETISSIMAPVDVNGIMNLVDNGASKEEFAKFMSGMIFSKLTQGKVNNNTNKVNASESPKPNELNPSKTNLNPGSNKIVPENLTSKITEHNTQLGVLNRRQGTISGAHKQDSFLESVEMTGAKINFKTTDKNYPGLIEYNYQIPAIAGNGPNAGKIIGYKESQTKTTYEPQILTDSKVAKMSNKAAEQAESYFKVNPDSRQHSVKVDGYWFQVTRDAKSGQINNAFITMPPRGSK